VKMLPPAVYQYKFIVDGEWKYAPDQVSERERELPTPSLLERLERPWHACLQDTLGKTLDTGALSLPTKPRRTGCCGSSGTCVCCVCCGGGG